MYPADQPKPHPTASAALPPPPDKPISYATAPVPAYSHLQTHDVRHHLPHVRDPQWSTQPYQTSTLPHNLQAQQPSPALPPPPPKDPSQQSQIPQVEPPPPPPHHYHHTINVVAPQSRPLPPPHQYMYLHPQVVAPVAHVPIGAAHYAHLPPSIWSPSDAQYHQSPPTQHHQRPIHAVAQTPHHLPIHASAHSPPSHLHHVHQPHPTQQVYPHALPAPHLAHHELHPQQMYQTHHVSYQYPHLQRTASSQPIKGTVAMPPATPAPVAYPETPPVQSVNPPKVSRKAEVPLNGHSAMATRAVVKTEERQERKRQNQPTETVVQGAANRTVAAEAVRAHSPKNTQNGRNSQKEEDGKRSSTQEQRTSGSPRQRGQQHAGQPARKPRKPYTITKSREVWTQEEHARFVQALQLYDRDWKKIEAYIGTKTVLQIRSHAQKHFGKVTKYQTGEYIPPPRPKKRAVLPYPRSRSSTVTKTTSNSAGTGSDSGGGSDNGTTSNGAKGNGSVTNGSSSATVSGLRASSSGDDQGSNGRKATTVRTGSRPHNHQQRARPGLTATNEKTKPMEGANHPYYDSAAGHSYQDRSLPRMHTLPPPKALDASHGPQLPPWNSLQSVSGNSVQTHTQPLFHSTTAGDAQDGVRSGYGRHGAQDNSAYVNTRNDNLEQGSVPSIPNKEIAGPAGLTSDPVLSSEQSRKAVRTVDGGNAGVVRAEDGGRVPGPNNSLLVLSNCVDMMSRETAQRSPAAGWATAAAARRAHRAKVIRGRKPPLQPLARYPEGELAYENRDDRSNGRGDENVNQKNTEGTAETVNGIENMPKTNGHTEGPMSQIPQSAMPNERGRSPPAAQDDGNRCEPHDPERSSAGSGSNSDDAIAGFSSSDRPSGLSSGGSGSGGSLESSDAGDEDPKSSNDGSGDDTNRQQSPSTRDSSPADPNSSGSRENTPNGIEAENRGNAEMNKGQVAERGQNATSADQRSQVVIDGSVEVHGKTGSKDVGISCKTNSIANLCSNVPRPEDKMRIENLDANSKKRPRSPLKGAGGIGAESANDKMEEIRERVKRKCHSLNGIVHRTSMEVQKQGDDGRSYDLLGEGSAG